MNPADVAASLDTALFRALAEPVRWQLLQACLRLGRADVETLAAGFPQDRSVISRHLAQLRDAGALRVEREGRHVFYQVNGPLLVGQLEALLAQLRAGLAGCCP